MKQLDKKTMLVSAALVLAGVVIGMIQPFINLYDGETRTVAVEGLATVKAEPDEYLFYPYFQSTAKTRAGATEAVTKLGDAAVKDIKKFGVDDSKIRVDISASEDYTCFDCSKPDGYVASYNIQITSTDKTQADKLQAYLLKSKAEGGLTPSASFSEARLEEIKLEARKEAVENAKKQASQIATELESELGKVVSIEEVTGFSDMPIYTMSRDAVSAESSSGGASSAVYAGEQEVTFTVKATFEIK